MSSPRPTPPRGKDTSTLSAVALVLSFVVGPLGAALGGWQLARRGGGRKLALAAVIVGIVQTVVIAGLAATGAFSGPASRPSAGPTATTFDYPTDPPASGPVPEPSSPTAGSAQPGGPTREPGSPATKPAAPGNASTAASLEEFVPEETGGYQVDDRAADPEAMDAGATRAERAQYKDADDEVDAAMAEWPTPEAAEAFIRSRSQADFPGVAPLGEGPIASKTGYYWYYEKDGVGTVYWHQGRFSATFIGEPYEVQNFFLAFPK